MWWFSGGRQSSNREEKGWSICFVSVANYCNDTSSTYAREAAGDWLVTDISLWSPDIGKSSQISSPPLSSLNSVVALLPFVSISASWLWSPGVGKSSQISSPSFYSILYRVAWIFCPCEQKSVTLNNSAFNIWNLPPNIWEVNTPKIQKVEFGLICKLIRGTFCIYFCTSYFIQEIKNNMLPYRRKNAV